MREVIEVLIYQNLSYLDVNKNTYKHKVIAEVLLCLM